ncbi:MAG: DUF134 domain-containing protein [Candidatus Bathyarchaeota archaeon]
MRGRRRRGRHGRLPLPVKVGKPPTATAFQPEPKGTGDPVYLEFAELEALRLVDLENLSQEEAGEGMGVSRGTVWRLLHGGRMKVAQALTEGRRLEIVQPPHEP